MKNNFSQMIPIEIVNQIVMMSRPKYPFHLELRRICKYYYFANKRSPKKKYSDIMNYHIGQLNMNTPLDFILQFAQINHKHGRYHNSKFRLSDIKNKTVMIPLKVLLRSKIH